MDKTDKNPPRETDAPEPLSERIKTPPASKGPRVFGDYELLASIGQGGMGEIFLARRSDQGPAAPPGGPETNTVEPPGQ